VEPFVPHHLGTPGVERRTAHHTGPAQYATGVHHLDLVRRVQAHHPHLVPPRRRAYRGDRLDPATHAAVALDHPDGGEGVPVALAFTRGEAGEDDRCRRGDDARGGDRETRRGLAHRWLTAGWWRWWSRRPARRPRPAR